jgi:hypothetical protein
MRPSAERSRARKEAGEARQNKVRIDSKLK